MGLSLRRLLLAAIGLLVAASVFGGEITLYEHQDFGSRRITLRDALANLEGSGFNDRASSIMARRRPLPVEPCAQLERRGGDTT